MSTLKDKRFLVTGASSGIGEAVVRLLAEQDARIVLLSRNIESLENIRLSLPRPDNHVSLSYDLSNCNELYNILKSIAIDGKFDGIVHSAGVRNIEPIRFSKLQTWSDTLSLNLIAAMHLMNIFLKKDIRTQNTTSAVFVSSVVGQSGQPGISAYCASKGALEAAARAWALELAPQKIRVNCVAPGYVQSNMLDEHKKILSPEMLATIVAQHPLGLGTPFDVAHAILFLLSEKSRWITGSTLYVDGGYSAQ